MPDYIYQGPRTSATLKLAEGQERDLILIPGRTVTDLPAEHPYVAALVMQKLLTPAPMNTTSEKAGDSALDGGPEGTVPAAQPGADASAPEVVP